jgi:hypothetical protein
MTSSPEAVFGNVWQVKNTTAAVFYLFALIAAIIPSE